MTMTFDTKLAIAIRSDLAPWQKLNVTAFLAGGLAGEFGEIVGEPYRDASGQPYTPMIRQPILVFAASADELKRTHARAIRQDVRCAVYTHDLFATMNDDDNRAAVAAAATDALDLVGLGIYADRKAVDKITKGLSLHK